MIERFTARAAAPRDALGLAAFRVLIGLVACVSALRFLAYGWVDQLFVAPRFFFHYWFAPFVEPLGHTGMHAVFWVMAAAGLLVAAGLLYRPAIVTLFASLTYVQLVDVTNYLNHYYLLALLAFLLAFMPMGDAYGLDGWLRARLGDRPRRTTVPAVAYWVLAFQVGVVYTYAGVAKLTEDWLVHAQPLTIWLSARSDTPLIGPALGWRWTPHLMSWAGCLFDLTIAWFLLHRRTRAVAFIVVIGFHALTRALFPIGMFPFIMVAGATAFFAPSWPRRPLAGARRALAWLTRSPHIDHTPPSEAPVKVGRATIARPLRRMTLAAIGGYCALQVLVPLRTFAYGGDVHWHEQGMRFSWRVMVREKNASVTYLIDDPGTGRTTEVSPRAYLDARQLREFSTQPDLILQLGKHIAREREARTGVPVRVRVDAIASLNGRRAARLVDPTVDLTTIDDGVARAAWILPLPEAAPPSLRASR